MRPRASTRPASTLVPPRSTPSSISPRALPYGFTVGLCGHRPSTAEPVPPSSHIGADGQPIHQRGPSAPARAAARPQVGLPGRGSTTIVVQPTLANRTPPPRSYLLRASAPAITLVPADMDAPPRLRRTSRASRESRSTTAWLCSVSRALYNRITGSLRAAFRIGFQAARLGSRSARYPRANCVHFVGSWPNHRRSRSLGAASLSHAVIGSDSFLIPRGHRRSTRYRVPSDRAGGGS